jgi:hypothetical protein
MRSSARAGHGSARRHRAYHRQPARDTASPHVPHPFGDSRPRSRSLTLNPRHWARTAGQRVSSHPLLIPQSINRHFNSNRPKQLVSHSRCRRRHGQYRPLRGLPHSMHPSSRLVVTVLDDLSLQDRAVQRNVGLVTQRCRGTESSMVARFRGQAGGRGLCIRRPSGTFRRHSAVPARGPASASSRRSGVSGSRDCGIHASPRRTALRCQPPDRSHRGSSAPERSDGAALD